LDLGKIDHSCKYEIKWRVENHPIASSYDNEHVDEHFAMVVGGGGVLQAASWSTCGALSLAPWLATTSLDGLWIGETSWLGLSPVWQAYNGDD